MDQIYQINTQKLKKSKTVIHTDSGKFKNISQLWNFSSFFNAKSKIYYLS